MQLHFYPSNQLNTSKIHAHPSILCKCFESNPVFFCYFQFTRSDCNDFAICYFLKNAMHVINLDFKCTNQVSVLKINLFTVDYTRFKCFFCHFKRPFYFEGIISGTHQLLSRFSLQSSVHHRFSGKFSTQRVLGACLIQHAEIASNISTNYISYCVVTIRFFFLPILHFSAFIHLFKIINVCNPLSKFPINGHNYLKLDHQLK